MQYIQKMCNLDSITPNATESLCNAIQLHFRSTSTYREHLCRLVCLPIYLGILDSRQVSLDRYSSIVYMLYLLKSGDLKTIQISIQVLFHKVSFYTTEENQLSYFQNGYFLENSLGMSCPT